VTLPVTCGLDTLDELFDGACVQAKLIFEPERKWSTGTTITCDGEAVLIAGAGATGTQIHVLRDLDKRPVQRAKPVMAGLLAEGNHWIAGGPGGIYHSTDAGKTLRFEAIEAVGNDFIRTIVRWRDQLWIAGDAGALLRFDGKTWTKIARPKTPRFREVAYGSYYPYPQVAISKLVVANDRLYVLGHGLWELDVSGPARLEVASEKLLVGLASTEAGTLLACGVGGTLLRKPANRAWQPVARASTGMVDKAYVDLVPLPGGVLLVGTWGPRALMWSADDGKTFSPLEHQDSVLEGFLERYRFHAALADRQGGAIVAGWSGLVVRVAPNPSSWTRVRPAAKQRAEPSRLPPPPKPSPARASDIAPFLLEIHATPDDDAPRLVYADWLSERGDPRGEFIQLQCRLVRAIYGARGYVRTPDPESSKLANIVELEAREAALYKKHQKEWMASIRTGVREWQWRRGFVDAITAGPQFFKIAETAFHEHVIDDLTFEGLTEADLNVLARTPLPGLRSLHLSRQRLTPKLVSKLLAAPAIRAVTRLDLWGNKLGVEGARAIAAAALPMVRALDLNSCELGFDGVLAVLDAKMPALTSIQLGYEDSISKAQWKTIRAHPRASLIA
jgi:uncharacterized protein (TIGR02996 family)